MAEVVDLCIVTVPARRGGLIDWIDRPLAWDMLGQSKLGDVSMWPNRKLIDLLGIDLPIIQAPMAGGQWRGHGHRGGRGGWPWLSTLRHAKHRQDAGRGRGHTTANE